MDNMQNSFGMFTANIILKPNTVAHLNRNQYIYKNADQWNYTPGKTDRVLVSYYNHSNNNGYADQIDLLTPMLWEEVEEWANKPIGKRGEDYVAMKNNKTRECIELASSIVNGLEDAVDTFYTSTPISYMTYTNTINGTAYGIKKDYTNTMMTILSARTPVKNLLLTGENLNLHGILGVSMTSCMTCAEIIGMEKISEELGIN
jgi:phytoene dehydrogenase-like protein